MLRDITLGQYYPADSILHRLDPRVKFVGTIVYVVSLFLFHNWGYLLGTVFLAVMIKLSKVPFKFITKGLKSIFVLLAITMVFNILFTPGEVLVRIWKITITSPGVNKMLNTIVIAQPGTSGTARCRHSACPTAI